ncbi:MAG: hypothetical protein K6E98_06230 [Lachnospiraceae bacterium]|nr:hypothetical protein [Lachnospiraceae bacterium]
MKILKNLSIRIKLLILTVPLAAALIIACVVMGVEMNSVEKEVTEIYYDTLFHVTDELLNADRDLYQGRAAKISMNQSKSDAEYTDNKKTFDEEMQQAYDRVHEGVDIAATNSVLYNKALDGTGETIQTLISIFDSHYAEALALGDTGNDDKFVEEFDLARDALSKMTDIAETWAVEEHTIIQKEITGKIVGLSIIFGILILVLIFLAVLIIREMISGVKSATESLNQLAGGNLNIQLPSESEIGKDEIGQMQLSTSRLTQKLRDIMSRSNEMARNLSSAGTDLASSSDQASQASGQVTTAVDEISQGAVSQAESVENAAGNTNDIGNSIEVIASNVEQLDSYAESMKVTCDEAMEALNKLLAQSRNVQESVQNIGRTIESTNESANSIHNFVAAITAIASQTNLLSLNASIEAARAGEAGRGFAVVAEEIAALAEQSNQSAQEIGRIVEQLLYDASSSVDVMVSLNESFEQQSVQMEATRDNMESMAKGVISVAESSEAIAQKIEGLTGAKDTLVSIVSDLSAISEENAASTEETNASMQELNATFSIINESASNLQELAKELQEIISYFG